MHRRRLLSIAACIYLLDTFTSVNLILGPKLLPIMAKGKGMSLTAVKILIGLQTFLMGLASFLGPIIIAILGLKTLLVASGLGAAVCGILFGVLGYLPSGWPFKLITDIVILCLGGFVGSTLTTSLAMLLHLFPDRSATVCGFLALTGVFSCFLLPLLSEISLEYTASFIPFLGYGSTALILTIVLFLSVPSQAVAAGNTTGLNRIIRRFGEGLRRLSRHPPFSVGMLAYFCFICSLGFSGATLHVFLESLYHMGSIMTGLLLSILGAGTLGAPVIGYLCDRFRVFMPFECIGFALMGVPFFLIAPVPLLLGGDPHLWLSVVCLVSQGLAIGIFIPSMGGELLRMSRFIASGDDGMERTVVGMLILCQALGSCCGFVVGGTMAKIGFSSLAIGFGVFECCIGLLWLTFLLFSKPQSREYPRREEREREQHVALLDNPLSSVVVSSANNHG